MINVLYRGGPLRRAPRPATRKAKPATPQTKAGDAQKKKKFEQRVIKMSISARRCRENLNNDCLQKIMGITLYIYFHVLVFYVVIKGLR